MADKIDVLLKMCDEHATQARQHENQRERITNFILIIVGILVTFISNSNFAAYSLPASALLIILGVYGYMFSNKHYERNRFHAAMLREFRKEVDIELKTLANPKENLTRRSIQEIRDTAESDHYEKFPQPANELQKSARSLVARQRLNPFWSCIPLLSIIIGLAFIVITGLFINGIIPGQTSKPVDVRLVE